MPEPPFASNATEYVFTVHVGVAVKEPYVEAGIVSVEPLIEGAVPVYPEKLHAVILYPVLVGIATVFVWLAALVA